MKPSASSVTKAVAIAQSLMAGRGLTMTQIFDPAIADQTVKALRSNSGMGPALSPFNNDFTSANVHWHAAKDQHEKVVAFISARRDQVADGEFPAFMLRTLARTYGAAEDNFSGSLADCPLAREMDGVLAYVGELFVAPTKGMAGRVNLSALLYATFALTFLEWKWDWAYAFLRDKDAGRGAGDRYLFPHQFRAVNEWTVETNGRIGGETLCAISRRDFNYLTDQVLQAKILDA